MVSRLLTLSRPSSIRHPQLSFLACGRWLPGTSTRASVSIQVSSCACTDCEIADIAFLGAPFDTATTGRPGARFGPSGIRAGSRRIHPQMGWSVYTHENAFQSWARIVDCGDAPLTFLDNTAALKQLGQAHTTVSHRKANATEKSSVPRIITLGGDHLTTLAALRSTHDHWGAVSVIHFDSHIDTWDPDVLGGGISHYAGVNHGTFL
jgi:agmatinase